ncbi:MAG TPA: hypothetical protein VGM90_16140 [Kofleriaceae bacterium]|jgi:hypothetical protein
MSMRSALLVAALSGAIGVAPASADVVSSQQPQAADIDPMLGVHFDSIAARADNDKLGFAKKRLVILGAELMRPDMSIWGVLFPADEKKKIVLRRVGKPSVVQSGNVAWFQQSYQYKYIVGTESVAGDGRASGLAIADGGKWQIVGMHYADQIADDKLLAGQGKGNYATEPPSKPTVAGDKDLGNAVVKWFDTKLSKSSASGIDVIAGGTAPKENATGAAAVKLAKTWDNLTLNPTRVTANTFGDGKIGFAYVEIVLAPSKGGQAVRVVLSVVARKEETGWRWLALQFSS